MFRRVDWFRRHSRGVLAVLLLAAFTALLLHVNVGEVAEKPSLIHIRPVRSLRANPPTAPRGLQEILIEGETVDNYCPLEEVAEDELWLRGVEDTFAAYKPCYLPKFSYRNAANQVIVDCPGDVFVIFGFGDPQYPDASKPIDITGHEFVRVYCNWPEIGYMMKPYFNLLPSIPRFNRDALVRQAKAHKSPRSAIDVNVYQILIDAVGRDHFLRSTPETQRLFAQQEQQGVVRVFDFERYHVVGWHSVQNTIPMLVGHDCGGKHHAKFYNFTEHAPKIRPQSLLTRFWTQYGYVTAGFSEDCQERNAIGPVPLVSWECADELLAHKTYEDDFLVDVRNPLEYQCYNTFVEHKDASVNSNRCLELNPLVDIAEEFERQYADVRKFMFFYVSQAHNTVRHDQVRLAIDQPLARLLRGIDLANSIVFVLADHGLHFGPHLDSLQGQREHKLPVLRVIVPTRVLAAHPELHYNLVQNQKRLVTPWDIYATIKHIATYPQPPPDITAALSRSLFSRIPANRTCAEAGIADEYCLCHQWRRIEPDAGLPELIQNVLDEKVNHVVGNATAATPCALLRVGSIERVELNKVATNPGVMFSFFLFYYRVRVVVQPGSRLFETVVIRHMHESQTIHDIYRVFEGLQEPLFRNTGDVVYLRRLTAMNDAEHAVARVPGLKAEFCVIV